MSYLYLPHAKPAARDNGVPWILFAFVVVALFVIFHWPLAIRANVDDYNEAVEVVFAGLEGSVVREIMLVALCVVSIVSLVRRTEDPPLRMNGRMGWFLVAFLGWALLSMMWAQDLSLTLKRLTSFVILCVFAVAIVRRLSLRQILLFTFFTTALFLGVAISSEIITGIFKPFAHGYRFSGIQHPNAEGVECALLAFSGFVAGSTEKQRKWLFWSCGLIGALFLLLTASRTTLAGTTLAFVAYGLTVSRRKTRRMLMPLCGLLACLVVFLTVAGSFQGLWGKLFPGRDEAGGVESFAGRSSVWADIVPYIHDRPIVGYGYGGFWTPNVKDRIADEEGWDVPDGHSTYVDCILALGGVGIVLNTLYLFAGLGRSFLGYRRTRDPHFAFLAGILIFCVIDGFLESSAGEVSLLACLSTIALVRLAFVPLRHPREIVAAQRAMSVELHPAFR